MLLLSDIIFTFSAVRLFFPHFATSLILLLSFLFVFYLTCTDKVNVCLSGLCFGCRYGTVLFMSTLKTMLF